MRFYLSSDECSPVILDVDIHADYIDDVIADDWLEAREAISEAPPLSEVCSMRGRQLLAQLQSKRPDSNK
jgi:hypothetical protein